MWSADHVPKGLPDGYVTFEIYYIILYFLFSSFENAI